MINFGYQLSDKTLLKQISKELEVQCVIESGLSDISNYDDSYRSLNFAFSNQDESLYNFCDYYDAM